MIMEIHRPVRLIATLAMAVGGAGCAAGIRASPEVRLDPVLVPAAGAARLAPAGFLAGCWRATEADGAVVEESWSLPAGGLMLGWSRTLRPGRAAQFEQLRIELV